MKPDSPTIPGELKDEYGDWEWEVVSQHFPEAVTYRLRRGQEIRFLKMVQADWFPSPIDEAARTRWAVDYLPVPRVIQQQSNGRVSWLITRALPGHDATASRWATDPERLVRTLSAGLRALHDAPVERCPFDFRLEGALDLARNRLDEDRIEPDRDFHPEFAHLSASEAVERLVRTRPQSESLVVCHGDYCLPNVLIEDWVATGFIDLGELGTADRWWDLAVATWSVTWNLGPGYEDLFLEEYGIERDQDRMEYYRLLYDVVS